MTLPTQRADSPNTTPRIVGGSSYNRWEREEKKEREKNKRKSIYIINERMGMVCCKHCRFFLILWNNTL